MASLTPWSLYRRERTPVPVEFEDVCWPPSCSGRLGEEMNKFPLPGASLCKKKKHVNQLLKMLHILYFRCLPCRMMRNLIR